MPLTDFQRELLAVLGPLRTPESYLAGGAALHFEPNTLRFSRDLDFFHDSEQRVAEAFAGDREALRAAGYGVEVVLSQPGNIRALVNREGEVTHVDWGHDSAWRFMPVVQDPLGGYLLHEIDIAVNKVLALAGRNEIRDYVDVVELHRHVLSLGALAWGAVGKDPGFTPLSLLEQLKRRGRFRPDDVERLDLTRPFDLTEAKQDWLRAIEQAERFVEDRPHDQIGCLYWSPEAGTFVTPEGAGEGDVVPHYGRPGGVLPSVW